MGTKRNKRPVDRVQAGYEAARMNARNAMLGPVIRVYRLPHALRPTGMQYRFTLHGRRGDGRRVQWEWFIVAPGGAAAAWAELGRQLADFDGCRVTGAQLEA